MKRVWHRLERYSPPGYEWKEELNLIVGYFVVAVLISFWFFREFQSAMNLVSPSAYMPPFEVLIKKSFFMIRFLPFHMARYIWLRYQYFNKETKSIYLMLRLPRRFEYHFRCWALPVIFILSAILLSMVTKAIYFLFYTYMVPLSAWPPGQSMNLWSVIL